jgi:hypothetical protein
LSHQTVIIKWAGPVSVGDLANGSGGGLYLFTGRRAYERNDAIQYCGITVRDFCDRFVEHEKIPKITKNLRCWTGTLVVPKTYSRETLEAVEKLLIYMAQPHLNVRKKDGLPKSMTVISHWFKASGAPRYNRKGIFKDFPDVISWDGKHWREVNLRVFEE